MNKIRRLKFSRHKIRYLLTLLGLMAGFAVCANDIKPLASAQRVQGSFSSSADQASFAQALNAAYGAAIKINHPDDSALGDGAPRDQFGASVAISGTTVLVGAPQDANLTGVGSAYVFERVGSAWQLQAKLTAADAGANAGFGSAVSLEGDTAVIGAYLGASAIANSGAAYVFTRTGTVWGQQAKLSANDASSFDHFGISTAISGDSVLIGAHRAGASGSENAGSAYVFLRTGSSWQQQAKLLPANGAAGDYFGGAVALSGNTAVIGAPRNDSPNAPDAGPGSAYVFVRNNAIWSQQAQVYDGTYTQVSDHFGRAVAVSGDAMLVGAPGNDAQDNNVGSGFYFTRVGASWNLARQVFPIDTSTGRRFGSSVALSTSAAVIGSYGGTPLGSTYLYYRSAVDLNFNLQLSAIDAAFQNTAGTSVAISGNRILVGTPLRDAPGVAEAGAAMVFTPGPNGGAHEALLTAGDGAGNDQFGASMAISGNTALVGAPLDDHGAPNAGSAFIFIREAERWRSRDKLLPPDPILDGGFGLSVALSGDTAVVGAPRSDSSVASRAGAAYVFVRKDAFWLFQAKLSGADGATQDSFGAAVAIAGDTIVIGAKGHDLTDASDAGAAYVFTRNGAGWSQQAKLIASDAAPANRFGTDVAVLANEIIIGAPNALQSTHRPGAAYVYTRNGASWSEQLKLTGNDPNWQGKFGQSVALSDNTLLIGAPSHQIQNESKGAAYVFVRNGLTWSQQALLVPNQVRQYEGFGSAVRLSGDIALIGAPHRPDFGFLPPPGIGAAYVFNRKGTLWSQSALLSDSALQTGFGGSVALSSDAAWIGTPLQRSLITGNLSVGTAYVFSTEVIFEAGFEN